MEATAYDNGRSITYYSVLAPLGTEKYQYNTLPLRTDQQIKGTLGDLRNCATANDRDNLAVEEGINGDHLLAAWDGSPKARQARQGHDPFVIEADEWAAMSDDIQRSNATTPAQIARAFDSPLDTRSKWTAETYSHFLLFLGPIVLQDRLPKPYYQHFLKLSAAARILTGIRIKRTEVNSISRILGDWVAQYEKPCDGADFIIKIGMIDSSIVPPQSMHYYI
ncbi:hypothetical protein QFC21_005300 [Naganishia friedmannii]|uniref:Uncharacterized protein n=1 Tax=Naganishia friedmannii TaxID=89922 RepID=A0ACC2VBH8_9TREE|nr:hypothetical protein QFC21_005300 [Naganishia friedmannii]